METLPSNNKSPRGAINPQAERAREIEAAKNHRAHQILHNDENTRVQHHNKLEKSS